MKNGVNRIARAKLKTVISIERFTFHAFAIDEGAVLAALVLDKELPACRNDEGMIAGNPGVGDYEIFFQLSTNSERAVVEVHGALLGPVNENEAGKDSG